MELRQPSAVLMHIKINSGGGRPPSRCCCSGSINNADAECENAAKVGSG